MEEEGSEGKCWVKEKGRSWDERTCDENSLRSSGNIMDKC